MSAPETSGSLGLNGIPFTRGAPVTTSQIRINHFTMCYQPLTIHHQPFIICYQPFTNCYQLLTIQYQPFTIYHQPFTIQPFTIHYSQFTIHHQLFTINHSLLLLNSPTQEEKLLLCNKQKQLPTSAHRGVRLKVRVSQPNYFLEYFNKYETSSLTLI